MQEDLFADRTSTATMLGNQFASVVVVVCLMSDGRAAAKALAGTVVKSKATCGTLRLKLLKISAWVVRSVRRGSYRDGVGFPYQDLWSASYTRLPTAAD
ncbi:MAG: transposase [Lysobacterales bacterium]